MFKFSRNTDFDFGIESTSFIYEGRDLTKRASAKHLLKFDKTAGQTDLHLIALGAYEGTGLNRNCDGFMEEDCKKNYHFFKQADRAVHRHHKNKDSDPKYGNIKAAAYNDPMKRIELIVGLDNDKCSDILQEQEKQGQTNWSMASKQAFDVCSWCKHQAHSDDDRCEHIPTKLGELNKQGEICGMINPNPKWFEISYVRRPADRIGMSLEKLSNDVRVQPMLTRDFLQIYTDFTPPVNDDFLISKKAADKRDLVLKLSELEKHVDAIAKKAPSNITKTPKIAEAVLDDLRNLEPGKFFKLAADKGIILSPENFISYVFGSRIKVAESAEAMKSHLSHVYTDLIKDAAVVNNEKYEPNHFGTIDATVRAQFDKLAKDYSLFDAYMQPRFLDSVLNNKTAAILELRPTDDIFDKELAKQYAGYKLAALNYLEEVGKLDEGIMLAAVLQNR